MACISINTRVLNNLNSDNISAALNEIIENELSKDVSRMNTALIDDCVNALIELEKEENSRFNALVPLLNSNEFLKAISPKQNTWKNLNVFARAALIAAILAASAMTASAAYKSATGGDLFVDIGAAIHSTLEDLNIIKPADNSENKALIINDYDEPTSTAEEETTTAPAEPSQVEYIPEETTAKHRYIDQLGDDEEGEETTKKPARSPENTTENASIVEPEYPPQKAYVTALEAKYNNFKTDYIYGEELSYEGLTLTAVYSDGSKKEIPLSDCDYTKSVNMNATADYTLRVIYENCVIKIDITVRPDEETRGADRCENEEFEYFLSDKGAYITKYKGSEKNIELNTVDGKSVYAIGSEVFKDSDIQSITAIYVKKIFASAFENCSDLKSAVFGNDLSYIGNSVFKNSGIEELALSNNITDIPQSLCESCKSLKKVTLGTNTAVIGNSAFAECEALETVINTANITEAEAFAFYNCTELETDSSLGKLEKASEYAFAYCKKIEFGALSSNINEIGKYAFAYCNKLTELSLPEGFTVIPEGAFRGAHIGNLTLPEGIKTIEDYAFMSTEFRELAVPNSVREIGTYALYSVRMRNITFGSNVEKMGENAVFKSTRLNMNVYANSIPYKYAVENSINYTLIE